MCLFRGLEGAWVCGCEGELGGVERCTTRERKEKHTQRTHGLSPLASLLVVHRTVAACGRHEFPFFRADCLLCSSQRKKLPTLADLNFLGPLPKKRSACVCVSCTTGGERVCGSLSLPCLVCFPRPLRPAPTTRAWTLKHVDEASCPPPARSFPSSCSEPAPCRSANPLTCWPLQQQCPCLFSSPQPAPQPSYARPRARCTPPCLTANARPTNTSAFGKEGGGGGQA